MTDSSSRVMSRGTQLLVTVRRNRTVAVCGVNHAATHTVEVFFLTRPSRKDPGWFGWFTISA